VVEHLNGVLADHYLLMLKTHNYHWNVKGTLFKSLHDLTEEHYEDVFDAIDELAERIRALGFDAPGTFSEFQTLSSIQEAQKGLTDLEMAADLVESHENLILTMRDTLRAAESVGDEVTVDYMVERLSVHEKNAWMLRSFIER
jgi:starvation-inducible DNA-binding protein